MNFAKRNYFLFFALIVFVLEAVLFSVGINKENTKLKIEEDKVKSVQIALDNTSVEAQAISVYDKTKDKKIYGKNDTLSLPTASITKIMTVIIALNSHSENDVISISPEAVKKEGDYGLFVNEKFKIEDLAKFSLIGSANDGAYAIAESTDNFIEKMNIKAKKLGMENTVFLNPTGLDIDDKIAGSYSTASDVNIMVLYALEAYRNVFSASVMPEMELKSESGFYHTIKNTDYILDKIPDILFSKTGFTPLAGGNLVIIYKNEYGHEIAITVLGSTMDGRFTDVEKIVSTLYNINYGE